ncbi:hypothetical protein D3C85_1541740 [compost metagenome]
MLDVKRVNRIQLAAVGTRRVQSHAVDQHHNRAATHVHSVVGAPLAADVHARNQLAENILELFPALNLLFNLLAFDNPRRLSHFGDGAMATVGANNQIVFVFLFCIQRHRDGQ